MQNPSLVPHGIGKEAKAACCAQQAHPLSSSFQYPRPLFALSPNCCTHTATPQPHEASHAPVHTSLNLVAVALWALTLLHMVSPVPWDLCLLLPVSLPPQGSLLGLACQTTTRAWTALRNIQVMAKLGVFAQLIWLSEILRVTHVPPWKSNLKEMLLLFKASARIKRRFFKEQKFWLPKILFQLKQIILTLSFWLFLSPESLSISS